MARTLSTATTAQRKATAAACKRVLEKKAGNILPNIPVDTSTISDETLLRVLRKLGVSVGPINDSTRSLYQRRLNTFLKRQGTNLEEILAEEKDNSVEARTTQDQEKKDEKKLPLKRGRKPKKTTEESDNEKDCTQSPVQEVKSPIGNSRQSNRFNISDDENDAEGEKGACATFIVERDEEITNNGRPSEAFVNENNRSKENDSEEDEDLSSERNVVHHPRLPVLVLETSQFEYERMRQSRIEEEDYINRTGDHRMTIYIFNTGTIESHESTLEIFNGRESLHGRRSDEPTLTGISDPHHTSQILKDTEEMDISRGSEVHSSTSSVDTGGSDASMLRRSPRNPSMDASQPMDMSIDTPSQNTYTVHPGHKTISTHNPILIVDTPKSSRTKKETRENSSHSMLNRLEACEVKESNLSGPTEVSPTFYHTRNVTRRTRIERSSEANTLRNLERTFIVRDSNRKSNKRDEEEVVDDTTFCIVPKKDEKMCTNKGEKSLRVYRDVARFPFKSPLRDKTFIVSQSPSRFNSKSPIRVRCPPKPLPRRIRLEVKDEGDTLCSVPMDRPVPAPRRIATQERRMTRNELRKEEKRDEISPVSLFNTQPRPRIDKEALRKQLSPLDEMAATRLSSIREEIKEMRRNGRPTRDLDYEARMIVESSRHLQPFFY